MTVAEKRQQLQVMLDAGLVMLHLDPRGPDVIVPERFKSDPVLRLNLAWGFNLPALDIGEDGVYAVLSFNRQNFGCTLPWASIFAMTAPDAGHEGVVWPESVPVELAPYFRAAGTKAGAVPVNLRAEERPRRPEPIRREPNAARRPDAAAEDSPPAEAPPRPLFIVHEGGRKDDATAPPDDAEDGTTAADSPAAPPAEPRPRPKLRLVKD